jgi:hypothetical protein
MSSDLSAFLLTREELLGFNESGNIAAGLPVPILTKLSAASEQLRASFNIDKCLYDHIYVTSDIHADLKKLDKMLTNIGVVQKSPRADNGTSVDIVNILCTEWAQPRTLVILVGDIVDGARKPEDTEIEDPAGNIELLLHAYLYNLRIKARMKKSELRFLIGNHDYYTIIANPNHTSLNYFQGYVHTTAIQFFGTLENRRVCLMPFYNCCPYVFTTVDDEIACVHGGLHAHTGVDWQSLIPHIKQIQTTIDAANNVSSILDPDAVSLPFLTVRDYVLKSAFSVCPNLGETYKTIVVGHCQMGYSTVMDAVPFGRHPGALHTSPIISTRPEYTRFGCGYDGDGCVVTACSDNGATYPHLAFVDIGFSRAFSDDLTSEAEDTRRRAEMLYFIHDPLLPTEIRHYNEIVRINAGGPGIRGIQDSHLVWQDSIRSEASSPVPQINANGNSNYNVFGVIRQITPISTYGGRRRTYKSKRAKLSQRKSRKKGKIAKKTISTPL